MFSRIVFLISVAVMCYTSLVFYPRWTKTNTEAAISWDASGYYWYLPSIFIYHDLRHQSFKDSILQKYKPTNTEFQQGTQAANGNYVMKYSSGVAVMLLPFFTASHLVAGALGYPRDGFSAPYQLGVQLAGLFISLLGLWYLRKFLLLYYTDTVTGIVLGLLVIGTNYLNYAAIDCGMSHCWLFTVYVFLLLSTHFYFQTFKLKYALCVGALVGLAILTRPTEIVSCLIPIFWGMGSVSVAAISNQLQLFRKNLKTLIPAVLAALAVVSIQLIYWKYASGHWLYYSYGEQSFSFTHPHVFQYTFSYRTGWLRYTPMFFLSFAGVIPFIRSGRNTISIIAFFFLNYYIVCAWDIWWYGGRAMVQSYPVLLMPMAAFVEMAWSGRFSKAFTGAIAVICIYMNLWITWMYHKGNLYDQKLLLARGRALVRTRFCKTVDGPLRFLYRQCFVRAFAVSK